MDAKQQVLEWVKQKAGKNDNLNELLIALNEIGHGEFAFNSDGWLYKRRYILAKYGGSNIQFDLQKNLHEQPPEFYEAILPLTP